MVKDKFAHGPTCQSHIWLSTFLFLLLGRLAAWTEDKERRAHEEGEGIVSRGGVGQPTASTGLEGEGPPWADSGTDRDDREARLAEDGSSGMRRVPRGPTVGRIEMIGRLDWRKMAAERHAGGSTGERWQQRHASMVGQTESTGRLN
uniref:Uncharacterized protein n=1 Tax=Oryza sativa subsp. japonica TaxID=39947 RepID=Q6Z7G1_ORYSJ|nr:hypothetical protein [Oryza sativa Japonica Group]BAD17172.1 hypothetical protein [Oryza sativa Japonica Group]